MNKRLKLVILSFLYVIFFIPVMAQEVRVGVAEVLDGKITRVIYDSHVDGIFKVETEFFNTGSVGYRSRVRLDVYDHRKLVFTGWSSEKDLPPGERASFTIYWYPGLQKGVFTGKIRVYYGNEIKESDPIKIFVKNETVPKQAVEILKVDTFEDEMEILMRSNESLSNVIIIPSNYPLGWVFEQRKLDKLEKNVVTKVNLGFKPSLWLPTSVTVNIVTEDGNYFSSKSMRLEKESGFTEIFYRFLNNLRVLLNI